MYFIPRLQTFFTQSTHIQWRLSMCTIFHSVGENSLKAANPPGFLRLSLLSPSPSSLIQHETSRGWVALLWVVGWKAINNQFSPSGGTKGARHPSLLFFFAFYSLALARVLTQCQIGIKCLRAARATQWARPRCWWKPLFSAARRTKWDISPRDETGSRRTSLVLAARLGEFRTQERRLNALIWVIRVHKSDKRRN